MWGGVPRCSRRYTTKLFAAARLTEMYKKCYSRAVSPKDMFVPSRKVGVDKIHFASSRKVRVDTMHFAPSRKVCVDKMHFARSASEIF